MHKNLLGTGNHTSAGIRSQLNNRYSRLGLTAPSYWLSVLVVGSDQYICIKKINVTERCPGQQQEPNVLDKFQHFANSV